MLVRELGERHKLQSGSAGRASSQVPDVAEPFCQLEEEIVTLEAERQAAETELGDVSGETEGAEIELRQLEKESATLERTVQRDEEQVERGTAELQVYQSAAPGSQFVQVTGG